MLLPCFSQPFSHSPHSGCHPRFLCSDASHLSNHLPHPSCYSCLFLQACSGCTIPLTGPSPFSPLSVYTSPLILCSMRCRQQPHCFPKSPRSFINLMAFPFLPGLNSHQVFLQKCPLPELTIKLCVCARERGRGRGRGEGGRESNATVWQREAALESC